MRVPLPAAMMITFTAMCRSSPAQALSRWLIIGVAALMLSACSAARFGYNNGPSFTLWWLDGYLDLDAQQEAQARPLLQGWFDWHRSTQLPDYAALLSTWTARAGGEVTGAEVCRWSDQTRERLLTAADRLVPAAADLLPGIQNAQWQTLEKKFAGRLSELREERLQGPADRRLADALDRAVERGESFYGPLTAAQRQLLAERLASSPLEARRWLDDRESRQRALLQGLRGAQQLPDSARRAAALRELLRRYWAPADGEYGALQARWQAHTCETSAALHNSASPGQRQHLRERLAAWEEDVRVLAAAAAN
jgi:hypothetical protein